MVSIIESIKELVLVVWKYVGIVSYNETPVNGGILNEITPLTDFELMGRKVIVVNYHEWLFQEIHVAISYQVAFLRKGFSLS